MLAMPFFHLGDLRDQLFHKDLSIRRRRKREKKSRIRETKHLSTNAVSSTDTKKNPASKAKFAKIKIRGHFTPFMSKSFQTWHHFFPLLFQSVANNFSDEQIQIWILFAKDILYKYKYEYYSWHLGSQIWIRILFVRNIHEYIRIFKYIQILENNQIPDYCYLPVWRL